MEGSDPPRVFRRVVVGLHHLAFAWSYALLLAFVFYWGWESDEYARLLNWDSGALSRWALREAKVLVVLKTVTLLTPAVLLTGLTSFLGSKRQSRGWGSGVFLLSFWLFLLDRSLFLSVGRHLTDLWAFRSVPQGAQAAGQAEVWVISAVKAFVVAGLVTCLYLVILELADRSARWHLARTRSWVRNLWTGGILAFLMFLLVLISVPHARSIHLGEGPRERLYGLMPLDVRPFDAQNPLGDDSPEGRLARRLDEVYRRHFSQLRTQSEPQIPQFQQGPRPHIVLIVFESWRKDALSRDQMPRLFHWAQSGHWFDAHEAGTYSSEAGMYSLLYGRNNLTFHETLDAKVRPLLFTWLRRIGYEISYYSGHPIKWLRREEFLSADTVDHLVHSDEGAWPDWDRRALAKMAERIREAKRPSFSLVFLMSSHFEYQYPPEYEKHVPVARSKFQVTRVSAFDETDKVPHHNRYKNSMAFLDDVVTDTLEKLPEETLVVLVGDHGESFYEGGHYGHGFAFTDAVLDVPLVIRFPPTELQPFAGPSKIVTKTLHRDLIGWMANYLNGGQLFLDGFHGRQSWALDRAAHLSVYSDPGRSQSYSMLSLARSGQPEIRLRATFRTSEPRVRLLGFEQKFGLPTRAPRLDDVTSDAIVAAMESELESFSR